MLVNRRSGRLDRRIDAARMMTRMIYRIAVFVTLTFVFASCTSTDFQSWEGRNSVVEGHGGTRKAGDVMHAVLSASLD